MAASITFGVFFIVGIFFLYKGYSLKHSCSEIIEGTIISSQKTKTGRGQYHIIVSYLIGSTGYTFECASGMRPSPENKRVVRGPLEGDSIALCYNPRDPHKCCKQTDSASYILWGWIFSALFGVATASCLWATFGTA